MESGEEEVSEESLSGGGAYFIVNSFAKGSLEKEAGTPAIVLLKVAC